MSQDALDLFTQPEVSRVVLDALMPIQVSFQTGCVKREGQHLVRGTQVQQLRMPLRQGQKHVRLTHHHTGCEIIRAPQAHLSSKSSPAELDVDQARTAASRGDLNVALSQVRIQVERTVDRRVSAAGKNHEGLVQEPLLPDAIAYRHRDFNRQID